MHPYPEVHLSNVSLVAQRVHQGLNLNDNAAAT